MAQGAAHLFAFACIEWRVGRKGFYLVYFGIVATAALVLIPCSPVALLTEAVQTRAGILLSGATVFLLLLCNDKAVFGPWGNSIVTTEPCPLGGLACFITSPARPLKRALNAIADEGQAMDQNQLRRTISLARRAIGLLVLLLFAILNPTVRSFTPNLIRVSAHSGVTVDKGLSVPVHCRVYGKYCVGKFLGGM